MNNQVNTHTAPTLPVPTAFKAAAGLTQMTLIWDTMPGALSYTLYRSQLPGVSKLNGVSFPNVSSGIVQTGLASQAVYYYVITATYAEGESAESPQVSAETGVIDNGNGTVYIYAQNLTWSKCVTTNVNGGTTLQAYPYDCSNGSAGLFAFCALDDNSCTDGSVLYALGSYSAVWNACAGMTTNHFQMRTWRVPTYVELAGMAGHYANNTTVWDRMPSGFFWTADANPVHGVDIVNNVTTTQARTVPGNVLCVSDGI